MIDGMIGGMREGSGGMIGMRMIGEGAGLVVLEREKG